MSKYESDLGTSQCRVVPKCNHHGDRRDAPEDCHTAITKLAQYHSLALGLCRSKWNESAYATH